MILLLHILGTAVLTGQLFLNKPIETFNLPKKLLLNLRNYLNCENN